LDHTGAWSWEDEEVAPAGGAGWTHTSKWVAVQLTEPVTLSVTMARDTSVPFAGSGNVNGFAATDHLFPSLTLWRGWDNDDVPTAFKNKPEVIAAWEPYGGVPADLGDWHTYANRGNVEWAEDLSYIDHYDNSHATSITRSWTLPAGHYSFALGSNSPSESTPPRQGFRFSYTTSAPGYQSPVITRQPRGADVLGAANVMLTVAASGPDLSYQWYRDGVALQNQTSPSLALMHVTAADEGSYTAEVRNAAGWFFSLPAVVKVTEKPVMNIVALPDITIGQQIDHTVTATNRATSYSVGGRLPRGVRFLSSSSGGRLFGVAKEAGDFTLSFKARNRAGASDLAATDTLTVEALAAHHLGTFNGLLARSSFLNGDLGGCIKITVTSVGTFTGSLKLGVITYPLSGTLDTATDTLSATQTIHRKGQQAINLDFTIPPIHRLAIGTVTQSVHSLPFVARGVDSDAPGFAGYQTLALKVALTDLENAVNPAGHGFGAFTVNSRGIATGFFTLADETRVTFSTPVETNGSLSLFHLLYKQGGSTLTQFYMDSGEQNDLAASTMDWLKKPEPASSRSVNHKAGFGPLSLNVTGREYTAPSSGIPLDAPETSDNGRVTLDSTPARLSTNFTITRTKVTASQPNPNQVKATINAATGLWQVSFNDGGRKATAKGVIVSGSDEQRGYGHFLISETATTGANRLSRPSTLEKIETP
jgi:hypothetical protein